MYVHPDIVTVCGEPSFEDAAADTLLNPALIIEVLSDSTGREPACSRRERTRLRSKLPFKGP